MSPRQAELLEAAYRYALDHGLTDLSLRPLAAEIGSSPRVLLFLFGSKEGLVRALLARARTDELTLLNRLGPQAGLTEAATRIWEWLSDDQHRPLLRLWVEAYARSLVDPTGPWAGFARTTVEDWLDVLAACQSPATRSTPQALTQRTLTLTILRGALLDLLATGDHARTTAAVARALTLGLLDPADSKP
nr:TetR family transcriptional regulator [Actinoplanes derwentensis]